jgi:hypothetical protein
MSAIAQEAEPPIMQRLFFVVGIVACLIGLVWIGQGTGYFPYPERSFMISQMPWAYRGAVLAVGGGVLIWLGRRRA